MGGKKLQGRDNMNKIILISIFILSVTILAVITLSNYNIKTIIRETPPKYPSTYFIEPPSEKFVSCYTNDDCIKIKGTACHPSNGGIETCVNKNYMQEYLSNIEILAGKEWEVSCPNINNTTNKDCSCINSICKLVSL